MKLYVNGRIVPDNQAVVSVRDRGFLYGDGVYETLRVYGGRPFAAAAHWTRLMSSLRTLGIAPPLSRAHFERIVARLIRVNGTPEATVRLTISRGPGSHGFDPRSARRPTVVVSCVPFHAPAANLYARGICAAVVSVRRNSPRSLPPTAKTTNCLNGILAKMESLELGAFEGLFLDERGFLSEGTVTNLFLVRNGVLQTPRLEGTLLAGVTRDHVIALARASGLRVVETRLRPAALAGADEAFLTSTLIEIVPIRDLVFHSEPGRGSTRRRIGPPGPVTRLLMERFAESVRRFRRATV